MFKCSVCGEYDYSLNHKCDPMWYCVTDDEKDFPPADFMVDEGQKIYASDAKKAAVKFSEKYQARNSWYPSEMTVFVMDAREDTITKFVVNQEAVPSYWVDHSYEPETQKAQHPEPAEE